MLVESLQSPHSGRERITPTYVLKEWFGVRDPDTIQHFVPMLRDAYKDYLVKNGRDLSVVVDWQMVPEHTEVELPSVLQRFADETVKHWGEKEQKTSVSLDGYLGNVMVLFSKRHEIARVFKDDTGKTSLFIPNAETTFPGSLKTLVVFNAVNERIRIHANQQIEFPEIRKVLAGIDIPGFSNGFLILKSPNLQKAA